MLIYTNKSKLGSLNFFRICRDSITNSIIAEISWKKKHLFHWISKNFSYRFISGWLRLVLPVIAAATFWLRTIRWQTTERSNPMITSRHNTSIEMWSQNSIQMFVYSIKVFIYNFFFLDFFSNKILFLSFITQVHWSWKQLFLNTFCLLVNFTYVLLGYFSCVIDLVLCYGYFIRLNTELVLLHKKI